MLLSTLVCCQPTELILGLLHKFSNFTEFQIIRFVISTFMPMFFISFYPPPPRSIGIYCLSNSGYLHPIHFPHQCRRQLATAGLILLSFCHPSSSSFFHLPVVHSSVFLHLLSLSFSLVFSSFPFFLSSFFSSSLFIQTIRICQ